MTTETTKAKATLKHLSSTLDDLETHLEPLFSQTLPETVVALEPIQQAKLQTVLPYIVYDLIFIYLKSQGIDPNTHPVVPELTRVRQYFKKIGDAENPPTTRPELDTDAARRFIKHAISEVKWTRTAAEDAQDARDHVEQSTRITPRVTSKMVARAEYERTLRDADEVEGASGEEDEGGLNMFDDQVEGEVKDKDDNGSGGEDAIGREDGIDVDHVLGTSSSSPPPGPLSSNRSPDPPSSSLPPLNKRRRAPVDRFAGIGDLTTEALQGPTSLSKKAKKDAIEETQTSMSSGQSLTLATASPSELIKTQNSDGLRSTSQVDSGNRTFGKDSDPPMLLSGKPQGKRKGKKRKSES